MKIIKQQTKNTSSSRNNNNVCKSLENKKNLSKYMAKAEEYKIKLYKFMNECRTGDTFTHLSYHKDFSGKFNIPEDKIIDFTGLYIKCIEYKVDLSILEKPKDYSPLVIDVDLKKATDNNDRIYDDNDIDYIINCYTDAIEEHLIIPDKDKMFVAVFEKQNVKVCNDYIKDGIHIVFPDIITDIATKHSIRLHAVNRMMQDDYFKNYIEKADKIIDRAAVSSNCWFLYGSKKPDEPEPYKVTKYFLYSNTTENIINNVD